MERPRHETAARLQFACEFANAVKAIRKLDQRKYEWKAPPPKVDRFPLTGLPRMDLNGKETTAALSYTMPARVLPPPTHNRKRRDEQTLYWEMRFRDMNAFEGEPGTRRKSK